MKDEYDFSVAERGRFYSPGAVLVPPVRLETDVLTYLMACAQARDASLEEVVNGLLKEGIARLEAAK
jgi:hypothetical protein